MSYFEDYIEGGLCCEACGGFLDGDEPGFIRMCDGCRKLDREFKPKQPAKKRRKRSA